MITTNTAQGATPTHMEAVAHLLAHCTDSNTVKAVGNTVTVTPPGIHYIGCINPGVLPKWYVVLDTTEPYESSTFEGTYNVSLITWRQHPSMAGLWLRTLVPYATCYNTGQLLSIVDETCGVPSPEHVDRTPPTKKSLPRPTLKQQDHYEWAFKLGTLCSPGTPAPNWWAAFPKQGGVFYQPGVDSLSTLEKLFVLGTMCKLGTSLKKVVEASNLVPKHTIQKTSLVGLMDTAKEH